MSFVKLAPTDFVVSNDGVTAPAWTTGNPTLTSPTPSSLTAPVYVDMYASGTTTTQYSIAYGHISGSAALLYNGLVPSQSATRTIYSQFRNLVYADENSSFNFGSGNTASVDIYAININRQCYKESLFPGTFNLRLNNGGTIVNLTNDSNDATTVTYTDAGRVFNLVTGSNGSRATAADKSGATGSYGMFLPDVGLIILNPRALAAPSAQGGIGLVPTKALAGDWGNTAEYNAGKLASVLAFSGSSFTLNSYETISSDYAFVRVPNNQFNYTTNPSIISGSGALLFSTMINSPQTYMTTVGLYNDNQELLAVAKLSKPLVKDFTKEALIQVKLNW